MTLVLAAAVLADLCGSAPAPAPTQDPADSSEYEHVGDDARAAGDLRIAAIAYRKAIALDPANTRAQLALAALCREAGPPSDEAVLAAVEVYRHGDPERAAAMLRAAAADPRAAGAAHFFLGVIALDRHDGRSAVAELELARADPAYRVLARSLLPLAHRDGMIALALLVEPELDTNPQLVPDTPPAGATTGAPRADGAVVVGGTVTVRPLRWLAIRDALVWRKQRELSALDFVGENAQVAIEGGRARDHVTVRYDLDEDLLSGEHYLFAQRGTVAYRHTFGEVAATASYSVRRRAYADVASAFTGWVHAGDAGAIVHLGERVDLEVRGIVTRELTRDAAFSNLAAGGQLFVRSRPLARMRLAATVASWYAHYDAAEPDGNLRRDVHVEGAADVELDLGNHVIATGGASAARNSSTIEDFRYWKLTARLGLAVAFAGP